MILAAAGFEISFGKTDRQADKQTNAAENLPPQLLSAWVK